MPSDLPVRKLASVDVLLEQTMMTSPTSRTATPDPFCKSQADVVTIGETNFNIVATSSYDILCRFRFAIRE
jgi:hypothetical protein